MKPLVLTNFVRYLLIYRKDIFMKKWLICFCLGLITFPVLGQMDYEDEESLFIGPVEVNPSLSFLAPEIPSTNLTLLEVDFSQKEVKREVNMIAIMEKEKSRKPRAVDISSPFTRNRESSKGVFEVSDNVRFYNRGSNYDFYTGRTKNPAYREMQAGLFRGVYSPYVGGRYRTPYYASPFLR